MKSDGQIERRQEMDPLSPGYIFIITYVSRVLGYGGKGKMGNKQKIMKIIEGWKEFSGRFCLVFFGKQKMRIAFLRGKLIFDGSYDYLSIDQMEEILGNQGISLEICIALISAARQEGSVDDASVIIGEITSYNEIPPLPRENFSVAVVSYFVCSLIQTGFFMHKNTFLFGVWLPFSNHFKEKVLE